MKICEKSKPENGVSDESLCFTICDLFFNLKKCSQLIMALCSLLCTLCIVLFSDLTNCQLDKFSNFYLSVFPSTLGLCIAAYAIIIGFQSDTLKKLLKEDKQKRKPYDVICASMIFNGLVQTLTIVFVFAYQFSNVPSLFYISTMMGCYSLMQIIDFLLQLLGLRTFCR